LKLAKDDRHIPSDRKHIPSDWKSSEFSPDFLHIHRALVRRTKSCPMDKPSTVWYTLHDFQGPDVQQHKERVSVGTQTDCSYHEWKELYQGSVSQKSLRQVSFSKQFVDNQHLELSDIEKEFMNTEFENECNKEVIQALSRKPPDKPDDISRQRQLQVASITTSEIISPTLIMETELDTDTDTDSDTDIDSFDNDNIYEEVLNEKSFSSNQNHIRLSTKSSHSFGDPIKHHPYLACHSHPVKKRQLSRTNMYTAPAHRVDIVDNPWLDSDKKGDLKREKRFIDLKKTLSEKLSRIALNY